MQRNRACKQCNKCPMLKFENQCRTLNRALMDQKIQSGIHDLNPEN
jgi:hypothetical protein